MKKILSIILSLILILGFTSCNKWLDVNVDPDNPSDQTASVNIRLPWIQHYYMYAWGTANTRTSFIGGLLTTTNASNANGLLAGWNPIQSSCTTIYQNFFLGAGVNIQPMIDRALDEGAYHYAGAGYCIKAMGFMMMLDLHGEMPYTEAMSRILNPVYDDGETIYKGCLSCLDSAIVYLSKEQNPTAVSLIKGDTWNNGSTDKWLKLCYGLKARYLNVISKKKSYDPNAILAALEKAPQSNADNTIMKHYNKEGDATNFTVGDPYQANSTWNSAAYGTGQRITRFYANLLTNSYTGGSGVIDPRRDKILPAIMTNVVVNNGKVVSNDWKRDEGVDMMYSDIRFNSGPVNASFATKATPIKYKITDKTEREAFIADLKNSFTVSDEVVTVTYSVGDMYINSTNYKRAGDTVYVNLRSNSMSTSGKAENDEFYYVNANAGAVAGTGSFFIRPDSDSDILTYSEMCFIKAEVYLRLDRKADALSAYKEGVKASFDRMQTKLSSWKSSGTLNEDQWPMDQSDIDTYMASAAVAQTVGDLTMAEIMKQKMIALGFNTQIWNDMRRFNYSAGNIGSFGVVFPDYVRPYEFTATNKMTGTSPTNLTYWFRRFSQSSHESNYNYKQLMASNPLAMQDAIWSDPVWWDIPD